MGLHLEYCSMINWAGRGKWRQSEQKVALSYFVLYFFIFLFFFGFTSRKKNVKTIFVTLRK